MNHLKVIWLTGLSGAGKSTLANQLSQALIKEGHRVSILDGDVLRQKLSHDLGFSDEDRTEHIRRVIALSKQQIEHGLFVIVALISPFKAMRELARETIGQGQFVEVFVSTPLSVCEERDTKGLYQKARLGLIQNMTGIDSVYEAPTNPEMTIDTSQEAIEQSVLKILNFMNK